MKKTFFCIMIALYVFAGQANAARYTDNGDGTVTDNITGLMWQQQDDNGTHNWEAAIIYCEGLSLASHGDWRLPSKNELASIVDYSVVSGPVIDAAFFPSTKFSGYWSSTTDASTTYYAWWVQFFSGYVDNGYKTDSHYVRCVR